MRKLFTSGWEFYRAPSGTSYEEIKQNRDAFIPVTLPHDFAIERFEYFYQDAVGWYRKEDAFSHEKDERVLLSFDAVYMDSEIYVNGTKVFEWKYGYTPFEVDITDYLTDGLNELAVSVNYLNPNSRWYSGAGIIRNVWIDRVPENRIPRYGVYVHAEELVEDSGSEETLEQDDSQNSGTAKTPERMWKLTVDTEIVSKSSDHTLNYLLNTCKSNGSKGEIVPLEKVTEEVLEQTEDGFVVRGTFLVRSIKRWDIDDPNLYSMRVELSETSFEETVIGFRTIEMDPDTGMYLNKRHVKLNGVCEHHDFGMIGAGFYEDAAIRKLIRLKDMGVNSIRFSHNPVDPKVLTLCDRIGILVISEAFDMWEHQKTPYDYGRFFPEWHERDVKAWVRQDRNHPSLLMWCIGNEIYDIHLGERGRELVNELSGLVREYDPLHNGYITFASNYMPWENAQKAANDVEIVGYNYAEKFYEEHHREHPDWIIYGSETSSIVYSRGVYRFPFEISCMSDDDEQCSAMGNSTTSWGAESLKACIEKDRDMQFSLGQYIWTGHDYLGEPTPYHTKNSYFGAIDTAGFPKDAYYAWKAAWTDIKKEVVLHLSPDWDFNEGQLVDIMVTSNAPVVELFVNGQSLGKQELSNQPCSGKGVLAAYKVPFHKGEIRAVAYNETGKILAETVRTSYQDTASLCCSEEEYFLNKVKLDPEQYLDREYGKKLHFYQVSALDRDGNPVENASDLIDINVSGGGILLACDNGDSTDYSDQRSVTRQLFKGKLLIVVLEENDEPITVSVKKSERLTPVRKIELLSNKSGLLGPENESVTVTAVVLPKDASLQDVVFQVTDLMGNGSQSAKLIENNYAKDGTVKIKAIGDGRFKLRAFSKDESERVRIISELDFEAEGLGAAFHDPYEFVSGSVYSHAYGKVTNGNERGIATERANETVVVFENVDFGDCGTCKLRIPIFSLDYEKITIDIYDGDYKSEDCELICAGVYDHPKKWNVYQEEDFLLSKRLRGVHTLSFRTTEKIHMKGFSAEKYNAAYRKQDAAAAMKIYGDQFTVEEDMVSHIGNNVTIDFGEMDFGEMGPRSVTALGRARGSRNTVHIRFRSISGEEVRSIMEFDPSEEFEEQTFNISGICKEGTLQLIFLPGCDFDLKWIHFDKERGTL